jgi:hypothetical protein
MFYDVQYPCESTASTFHPPNPWYSLKVRAVTAVKLVSERRWDEKQRKFPSRTYPRRFSPVQDIRPWSCFGIRMGLDSVAFRSVMKICEIQGAASGKSVKLVSERRWDEKQRKFPSRTYPRRFSPVQDIRPWSCFGIRMGLDSVAFRSVMKICEICTNEHGIQSEIAMLRLWGWTSKNYGPGALRTFQSTYTSQWNRDHIREEQ